MAAPTGLSSGSVPEPVVPEAAGARPATAGSAQPQTADPESGDPGAAGPEAAGPEAAGPRPTAPEPPAANLAGAAAVPPGLAAELAGSAAELAGLTPEPPGLAGEPSGPAWEPPGLAEEPAGSAADDGALVILDPDREPTAAEHARAPRRAGRLAAAAIVIVMIALAGAVGTLVVVTHGFRPKTVVTYRPAAVFGLRAGDCINSSQNGLSVTILSCASPHDAEVFATFSLPGSSWPGSAAVQQQAGSGCDGRLAGYLNPALENAGLDQEYVYPDRQAWQAGVRTVVCEVSAPTGQLTGSVRKAG